MQKLQKSRTKLPQKPVKKPVLKKLIKPPRDVLTKSNTLSSPTSASSSEPRGDKHLDSLDSETELDTFQISKLTFSLKDQIFESLQQLRSASEDYIFQTSELKTEVDSLHKNFSAIPKQVEDLLLESHKSQEYLEKIKNLVDVNKSKARDTLDIDLSSVKNCKDVGLCEVIENLKGEVNVIREKVIVNESEVQKKELENSELRNLAIKMRESLVSMNDSKTVKMASCNCILF